MSENGDKQEYKLVNAAGDELKSSRNFTGKGVATYTNGDIYDGLFKDGVSNLFINKLASPCPLIAGKQATPVNKSAPWTSFKRAAQSIF